MLPSPHAVPARCDVGGAGAARDVKGIEPCIERRPAEVRGQRVEIRLHARRRAQRRAPAVWPKK